MPLLQSKFPQEGSVVDLLVGADCSPELKLHQSSHSRIVLNNILLISCFPRPVLDRCGPTCFSEGRCFTIRYALAIFFVQASFDLLALNAYQILLSSLYCHFNLLVSASLYSFARSVSNHLSVFGDKVISLLSKVVRIQNLNKRPEAKCPPTCEMSVCGQYVYNMYVKNAIKGMANSLSSPSQSPSPDPTQHVPFEIAWCASKHI